MTVPQLSIDRHVYDTPLDEGISWFDSDTGCTVIVSTPSADPALWADFVDGAARSYRRHGIEQALDMNSLTDEAHNSSAPLATSGVICSTRWSMTPARSWAESEPRDRWTRRRNHMPSSNGRAERVCAPFARCWPTGCRSGWWR